MCAIFGVLDFAGQLTAVQRLAVFRQLANAAQIRGRDASGVAFVQNGAIQIQKAPKPANRMRWRIAASARYLMGHTRMTTQGPANKNYNNHPFPGKAGAQSFALAHNGVLCNEFELRQKRHLQISKIKTDSYVAVQLLEQYGKLSPDTLCQMAEALEGTFTITVLSGDNTLYLVKGNNPLSIRLFPELGCYIYASTDEILNETLQKLGLVGCVQINVPIEMGDIMAIDAKGQREVTRFDVSNLIPQRYFGGWNTWNPLPVHRDEWGEDDYLRCVLAYGERHGVSERDLHLLLDAGYDACDLEELIRDNQMRESCIQEIMADFGVY